ncbi:MAG: ThuA domain-containing protein [Acidobacteriota bacterium]|nr:ThuA domain-containing protein [Acidobacteriota bacterium]
MRYIALGLGIFATLLITAGSSVAQEHDPADVLYLTQSAGFAHPVLAHSEAVLTRLASESDRFHLTVSHDASALSQESLRHYDAVVFFTTGELPMDAGQQQALLAYVRNGGAFVGVHSATDTFYEWPEYLGLIGGYFDGHPWHQEVTVRVEDGTHPSTQHLGESFRIYDEIYQHRNWSRDNVTVLLSLDVASVDMTARGINRTDQDFALAWTRQEGAGRVFYTALGHRPEVWDDPRFQTHLLAGIFWTIGAGATASTESRENTLTTEERANGWELLFDGHSLAAWRGYKRNEPPDGWQAVDGTVARVGPGGDLITVEQFADFELLFDWKVEEGGNSGVMFRVAEGDGPPWHTGPEFQILHNAGHRDGEAAITSAGSNYAVHPPVRDVTRPVGDWNRSRLVVQGTHVEHWMNDVMLLEYELEDSEWKERMLASKFADIPRYGRESTGHIAIQDHGDPVAFRNLKIRRLDTD